MDVSSPATVRTIISDWGNTIQLFQLDALFNWFARKFGIPRRHFWDIFSRLIRAYECGQPTAQFLTLMWKEVLEVVVRVYQEEGRTFVMPELSDIEFLDQWCRVWDQRPLAPELIRLFKEIKASGYGLYVLSNTNEAHVAFARGARFYGRQWWRAAAPILEISDRFIASCDSDIQCRKMRPEEGSKKECERIFRKALNIAGVRPEEAVLIDDIEPFCQVFSRMGGRAIHFKGSWTRVEAGLWEIGVRW